MIDQLGEQGGRNGDRPRAQRDHVQAGLAAAQAGHQQPGRRGAALQACLHLRDLRQSVEAGILHPAEIRRGIGGAEHRGEQRLLRRPHRGEGDRHATARQLGAGGQALAGGRDLHHQLAGIGQRDQAVGLAQHLVGLRAAHLDLHLPDPPAQQRFDQPRQVGLAQPGAAQQRRVGRHAMHQRMRQAGAQRVEIGAVEAEMKVGARGGGGVQQIGHVRYSRGTVQGFRLGKDLSKTR